MLRHISFAAFCLPSAVANEMVQESRCVKGSILLKHRLEKEYVEDDFHIFIACKGATRSNISTTVQAVASLIVLKILLCSCRPPNIFIPMCLAFVFR